MTTTHAARIFDSGSRGVIVTNAGELRPHLPNKRTFGTDSGGPFALPSRLHRITIECGV